MTTQSRTDPTATMQLPPAARGRTVYPQRQAMLQCARAAVHRQTKVAIRAAFYSGLRLGELYRVQALDGMLALADTKNGEPRIIPAHPRIATCLPFLPLTMSRITLQRDWQNARPATVGKGVRFHDLRHGTASEMINAGVPLHTVGHVLRHKDPRSTARYAHLQVDALAAAVGRIGRQKNPHNKVKPGMKKATAKVA